MLHPVSGSSATTHVKHLPCTQSVVAEARPLTALPTDHKACTHTVSCLLPVLCMNSSSSASDSSSMLPRTLIAAIRSASPSTLPNSASSPSATSGSGTSCCCCCSCSCAVLSPCCAAASSACCCAAAMVSRCWCCCCLLLSERRRAFSSAAWSALSVLPVASSREACEQRP
jgi:hypothetical protein